MEREAGQGKREREAGQGKRKTLEAVGCLLYVLAGLIMVAVLIKRLMEAP